jgi:hypothetical protein
MEKRTQEDGFVALVGTVAQARQQRIVNKDEEKA